MQWKKKWFWHVGIIPLMLPLGFFLLFTVGEMLSGEVSGVLHLIQAFPIVLLAWFALRFPRIGGVAMIVLSCVFGVLLLWSQRDALPMAIFLEGVLFIPLCISGILFVTNHKKQKKLR